METIFSLLRSWRASTAATLARRALIKTGLFLLLVVVVLNPNLKRAFLQVGHTLWPDSLIQTNFAAMPFINAQVDRFVAADHGRHSEARLVAKFVLKKIRYVSDYETWGNLDYWPTAPEVWALGQEDCDGRAVLAASILRSRGYLSAGLVVGFDHMWITVNENETNPAKPPHLVALLSPNKDFSFQLHERSGFADLLHIARALLHPAAFCDTSTHLFADIPSVRKAILLVALLLFCLHPFEHRIGVLAAIAAGLASSLLLDHWEPGTGVSVAGITGGVLLGVSVTAALFGDAVASRVRRVRAYPVAGTELEPTPV